MARKLPRLALSILLSALSGAAFAQEDTRRVVKAGADGRFEMQIDMTTTLRGHASRDVMAFRARVDEVVAHLRAMPAVNAPPYPTCSRLDSWLERNDIEPMLSATLGVHTPEVTQPGRCGAKSEMGVAIALNSMTGFLPPAHVRLTEPGRDWYVLPIKRQGDEFIEIEGDRILFFESGRTPFRPVSTERYARQQLAELTSNGAHDGGELGDLLRRAIASWSPEQLALPACVNDPASPIEQLEDALVRPHEHCPADRTVLEVHQAHLDRSRPARLQLIAVSNPPRASLESDGSWNLRTRVWNTLDHGFLRGQIGR
ncbi:MAG: hypothetical protein WCY15_10235 [Phenylobacterium sp.]|jgi:hypothetical protein|uniref:hypothetical protein n=1 Tax=Phenylobacterium sp. TaxID=1871053 RepID=UPI002A26CC67|nr:hypothetical protein [Phenylobacterium sp.]MDD3837514.1 hypothetical protein [Phenylobacterium sp.]MDX9996318.1 hypothetical protein [Phenylobacterium sp.]